MLQDLIRLLAWVNFLLAVAALAVAPALVAAALQTERIDGEMTAEAKTALAAGAAAGACAALLAAAATGLLLRRMWSKRLSIAVGILALAQAVWHAIRGEWGVVLGLSAYAALVAWILLPAAAAGYFAGDQNRQPTAM